MYLFDPKYKLDSEQLGEPGANLLGRRGSLSIGRILSAPKV